WPPGLIGLGRLDPDRALLRLPARRRPGRDQAARLAGLPRRAVPARAARARAPDDAAPVPRPAGLPEPDQGPGPGRLLAGVGRLRRDCDRLRGAGSALRRGPLRAAAA